MDLVNVVRNSAIYRCGQALRRWGKHSHAVRYATSEQVQLGVLVLVLLASLISISGSDMSVVVKFLSFVIVFLLTAIVTWSLTDPFGDDAQS